jgi:hypothetical protein
MRQLTFFKFHIVNEMGHKCVKKSACQLRKRSIVNEFKLT